MSTPTPYETHPATDPSDPLSDAATESGLCSAGVRRRGLRGAFALAVPPARHAVVHCVVSGKAVIAGIGDEPITLAAGEIAVLPHQTAHTIADAWPPSCDPVEEEAGDTGTILSVGASEAVDTVLLSLPFILPGRLEHPAAMIKPMLEVLRVPRPELVEMVLLVSKLAILPGPGDHYVACRIAEGVLTKALQQLAGDDDDRSGLFALFASAGVKAALHAVRLDPTRPWSVGELAELAAMPRAEFIARWDDAIGVTVQEFVTTRRVRLAETLLRTGAATVDGIAERVGFRSGSSFDRAFQRVTGHTTEGRRSAWVPRLRAGLQRAHAER